MSQKMLSNVKAEPMVRIDSPYSTNPLTSLQPYIAYSTETNPGTHPINETRTDLPIYIFGDGLGDY